MIIYQDGYLLKKRYFFKYFYFIFLYGFIGAILTFVIVYSINLQINDAEIIKSDGEVIHFQKYQLFVFSAILSSQECLSAKPFIDSHKYPKLFNTLYGEQAINDLVVFSLVVASAETYKYELEDEGSNHIVSTRP